MLSVTSSDGSFAGAKIVKKCNTLQIKRFSVVSYYLKNALWCLLGWILAFYNKCVSMYLATLS